jgi:hypothetical protein
MKKMITSRKAKLFTTALAAAMTMSMATPMIASAHNVYDESAGNLTEIVGNSVPGYQEVSIPINTNAAGFHAESSQLTSLKSASKGKTRDGRELTVSQEFYDLRVERLERLQNTKKTVRIRNHAGFHVCESVLYGKKIVGVDENGDFVLGGWERLHSSDSMHGAWGAGPSFEITGDYVAFSYTFDITWGTNYPFSGVFWNNSEETDWKNLKIDIYGTCRNAAIEIRVGDKLVVDKENLSAHDKWRP